MSDLEGENQIIYQGKKKRYSVSINHILNSFLCIYVASLILTCIYYTFYSVRSLLLILFLVYKYHIRHNDRLICLNHYPTVYICHNNNMPSVHYNIHNIVLQVEVLNKSYKAYSLYLAYPVHQHHLTPNHPLITSQ